MKKIIIAFVFIIQSSWAMAQAYQMGDVNFNVNYGVPQITPLLLKGALNVYSRSTFKNDDFSFSIKNSGVINSKIEYAVHEEMGLGIAISYWNMSVDLAHTFTTNNSYTGGIAKDYYFYELSALAIGLRGNYHFFTEREMTVWDPYSGFTAGVTRYKNELSFTSDDPSRTTPLSKFKWQPNYFSYFSGTLGVRIYPVHFLAMNFEVGWDRGAFLFGGLAFKIHTKPPKFLMDK